MISSTKQMVIQEFKASEQANLFNQLKLNYFTGQLEIKDDREIEYTFYLYLGRIIYATGGSHQVRRWKRQVSQHLGDFKIDNESLSSLLLNTKAPNELALSWEYLVLDLLLKENKITREQLIQLINSLVSEILFDLSQSGYTSYIVKKSKTSLNPPVLIDANQVIVKAWKMWQNWQSAKLNSCCPNTTPALIKSEELKSRISEEAYSKIVEYIDMNYSLRELAVKLNRSLISLTKALMIYVQLGIIELQEMPDSLPPQSSAIQFSSNLVTKTKKLVIGCVDDSPMVCQTLKIIFNEAGYEFVGVNQELQAFAIFLQRKPDLIFLDLIMPTISGYDLCAGLRKLSTFRKTPMIMLTQNSNLIDHFKGKIAGFNDFLSKPINSEELFKLVSKYDK